MLIVETVLFPQNDEFTGLRWIKGSGLQPLDQDANLIIEALQAQIEVNITPQHGLKVTHKTGGCLLVGDPAVHEIRLNDSANRFNPRLLATTKAAQPQNIKLYQQQSTTLLSAAGGVRGRLQTPIDANDPAQGTQDVPWALVEATYTPHDTGVDETFIAQADARGEFVIDLAGIRWPDDNSKPQCKLSIDGQENMNPKQPADPDQFISFDISSDGTVGNLGPELNLTLDNYGEVKKLGNLLVAKSD